MDALLQRVIQNGENARKTPSPSALVAMLTEGTYGEEAQKAMSQFLIEAYKLSEESTRIRKQLPELFKQDAAFLGLAPYEHDLGNAISIVNSDMSEELFDQILHHYLESVHKIRNFALASRVLATGKQEDDIFVPTEAEYLHFRDAENIALRVHPFMSCSMHLIIHNLCKNAYRASGKDAEPWINIRHVIRKHMGNIEETLSVEDDGPGIPREALQQLGRGYTTGGTGKGFMMLRRFAETQQGSFYVKTHNAGQEHTYDSIMDEVTSTDSEGKGTEISLFYFRPKS